MVRNFDIEKLKRFIKVMQKVTSSFPHTDYTAGQMLAYDEVLQAIEKMEKGERL
ncbi:MAG: hypothetical protein KBS62_03395 [Oscillospiraceae bacterium]|nr:hypothetical protein [Candidatus Ruminococcus equi]